MLFLTLMFSMPFLLDDDIASAEADESDTPPDPELGDGEDTLDPDPEDENPENPDPPEDLTILGTEATESLIGGDGNDEISGEAGRDTILGGNGNDTIDGGADGDSIAGGEGNDSLLGGAGDDWIKGEKGTDTMFGGAGDDVILDTDLAFDDGPNLSVIDGGDGNDRIWFDGGSTVTGGEGADELRLLDDLDDYHVTSITDFNPDEDSLQIILNLQDGGGGDLTLEQWEDGTGASVFYGDDLVAEIASARTLEIDDIDLFVQAEENSGPMAITHGNTDATILGNYEDNTLNGGDGDDILLAHNIKAHTLNYQAGSDVLNGGAGNDTLAGDGGNIQGPYYEDEDDPDSEVFYFQDIETDTLNGGAGDDVLLSFNGNVMTGGEGADLFGIHHDILEDGVPEQFPAAQITDFEGGEDSIVVSLGYDETPDMISVVPWDDGTGADITVSGFVIAKVAGGQALNVADISVVDWLGEVY